jgi:cyclohexa-1,5-dienecarbonyl-CoA hydratase
VTTKSSPVRRVSEEGGTLLRLVLDRPKANVLDGAMVSALRAEIGAAATDPNLRAIVFEGEGKHFSFGASVEEHRREQVAGMLATFHGLFRDLVASRKVLLSVVRGQCLGGGLELAAFCHRVFASPDAQLGCPEIKLGVFAPVGSIVLPHRVGAGRAADLLLSGRSMKAPEALAAGLVDEVADDPSAAALAWHKTNLAPLSSVALAHAARALRHSFHRELLASIDALERQYLEELVATHDANEGISAFLEKRTPAWTNR